MSAIFGIVGPASKDELDRMALRLRHKGRYTFYWSPAPNVWLGEVRDTPRNDDEAIDTAFSGQLYIDWRDVDNGVAFGPEDRDRFQRRRILQAIAGRGINFPEDLDGYFGVAWWDAVSGSLVLGTDRINYENIYFARTAERFAFASEYKALLCLDDVQVHPDPDALQYSIASFLPNYDGTLCAGIGRVRYGHLLTVSGNRLTKTRYFRPVCKPGNKSISENADALRRILLDQIDGMLRHRDRIAITLGGGLDSAGLLGMLRYSFPDKTIASYTIGTGPDDSEIAGAGETADVFGTEHYEFEFRPEAIVTDLPKLIWLAEEFASREESLLQYQLESRIVGREPVLTGGHGADMIFGGMPRHRLVRMAETLPFVKRGAIELYQQTQSGQRPASLTGRGLSLLAYRGKSVEPPRLAGSAGAAKVYEPAGISDMLNDLIGGFHPFHYHAPIYSLAPIDTFMPYMCAPVMDFSLGIPAGQKVGIFRQKIILREVLAPFLPDNIRNRPKAIQRARRTVSLSDAIDVLAAENLSHDDVRQRGLVDPAYVRKMRKRPKDGIYTGDQLSRLWMLICSEIWCRTFIDRRGAPAGNTGLENLRAREPKALKTASTGDGRRGRIPVVAAKDAVRQHERLQRVKYPPR